MSRSLLYLRRGLLGIAFVGSLGFGATQAVATPSRAESGSCLTIPIEEVYAVCGLGCPQNRGYCDWLNDTCRCGYEP